MSGLVKTIYKAIISIIFTIIGLILAIINIIITRDWKLQRNKPLADKLNELHDKVLKKVDVDSLKSEKITLESGIRLHVVTAGPDQGELVVLLHGFPENWYTWKDQIPFLVQLGYHVVAVDMRGYNLSEKPEGVEQYQMKYLTQDIAQVIKHFNKESAVIMGHDWGGLVSWNFAMRYPELVSKLIILDAPHPVRFFEVVKAGKQLFMSWYMLYFQIPYLPELLFLSNPMRSVKSILRGRRKTDTTVEESEYVASAWVQPRAMTSMLNYYRSMTRYPSKDKAVPITVPTMLLWGENDVALDVENAKGLDKKWVPNITVHIIPNCSHWITREAPEEVKQFVTAFLKQE